MRSRAGADPPPDLDAVEEAVVAWPELRDRLAEVGGLAAEFAAGAEARAGLARRLEAALEVRRESLRQGAALDEMRRRLELRRTRADEAVVGKRRAIEGVERQKEHLQAQIERVLPLSRALVAAHRHVQEAKEVLAGDKARLGDLQRLLRMRQQCMIGQVAALYPVRVFHDQPRAENHHADTNEHFQESIEHLHNRMHHFQARMEMEHIYSVLSNLHKSVTCRFLVGNLPSIKQSRRVTVRRSFRGPQPCWDMQHMQSCS